jgi:hypothetical protein
MEKEFIPYEQALALKELGFDEPCFKVYDNMGFLQEESVMNTCEIECDCILERCLAPLYQQAFRWFRKEYALESYIRANLCVDVPKTYQFNIDDNIDDVWYDTYEEAELECLKKLIEIFRTK